MRIGDWSSDVCSSDLIDKLLALDTRGDPALAEAQALLRKWDWTLDGKGRGDALALMALRPRRPHCHRDFRHRSEEHTSELQSLMRISYAVFCWNKKIQKDHLVNSHV